MTNPQETFDIAIIGYGPSGATLAHLLGTLGLNVVVLEREGSAYHFPRAVHFDDEVMRVFQTIGVAEAVAADTLVNPGMRFVDGDGALLLDWSRPQEKGRHGWNASYRFHQPTLEQVLNDKIARHPNVHVRRRCEAFLIDDKGNHVAIRYEDMSSGKLVEARAAHVVGCDGARSLVRRFIGSEMEDHGFHERWLVVDVLLKAVKPELGDHSVQYCHPERSMTYARQPGNRRRWEIRMLPGEDDYSIGQPERIWPLLARWITREEAEIERVANYTFHSLVAKRWRLGRLWIAGDAAHQTPPFMGQGMCAGIRDVVNLAWKIASALRGLADEKLLDSYQSERLPNVTKYITTAVRLGGLINASDPGTALQMAQSSDKGVSRMESLVSELGPGLGSGPHRGRLFGQPRFFDGSLMDDAVGYAPVLIGDAVLLANICVPSGLAVVTSKDCPDIAKELDLLGVRAVLLRPDRYVMATANESAELQSILGATDCLAMIGLSAAEAEAEKAGAK